MRNRKSHHLWVVVSLLALLLGASTNVLAQPRPKTRDVSGTVVDGEGKPLANATVTVSGGGPTATTGADGAFKLTGVVTTNVTLDVAAEGFTTRQIIVIGAATPLQLDVALLRPAAPPPVETRSVAGVVTDQQRNPVANAVVKIRGTALQTTTAADGTFFIPGVETADITLDVEAAGQPPTALPVPAGRNAVTITVGQVVEAPPAPTTRTIRGIVTDGDGQPVAAAQLTVVATGAVLFTDEKGEYVLEGAPLTPFKIEVLAPAAGPEGSKTLDVAAGIEQLPITVDNRGTTIVIEGRAPAIVRQSLANGSSSVAGEDLTRVTASTVDSAMQGKVPGANLQFNSGAPGGGAQLRLRGISTINGQSSPLYVIDGVIVSNVAVASNTNVITGAAAGGNASNQDNPVNRIADLNPNDIETLEVLKGASAGALYGSKAANGVVIITTKRGRRGENKVEVTQRFGVSQVSNRLGSRKFDSVEQVMAAYGENSPLVQEFMDAGGRTFDHEKEITRVPFAYETVASASGGTENGNYYGSLLVRNDPGVVVGTFYEKQTGRIAIGYRLGEKVRFGVTANLVHSLSDRGLTNNDNTGTSYYVVFAGTPNFVNLKPNQGVFPANPAVGGGANPLQTVQLLSNREDVWRLIAGSNVQIDAFTSNDKTSDVKVLGNFGVDSFTQKNDILSPNELIYEPSDGLPGTSVDASTTNLNWNIGAGAVWSYRPVSGAFRSALSGGFTYEEVDLNSVYAISQNLTAGQPNVDSGTAINVTQNRLRTKDAGGYLQEEVALLDERLSILGGLLLERSSLNGNTEKYFVFPKAAAVFSVLPAEKDGETGQRPLETVRVRAAYGETGNRPNFAQKFTALNATANIEGNAGLLVGGNAGDPDIEPERQREFEVGTDIVTKDQRAVLELSLYRRDISNLILQRALPTSTGFATEFFNGGKMRNQGVELALTARPVPNFDWTTRGALTLNRSKILDLPVEKFDVSTAGFGSGLGAFRIEEGKSATQIVGPAGREDGEDGVLGDGEPDFRIGWSNVVKYRNFTFSSLVDWQHGSEIVNLTRLLYDFGNNSSDPEEAAIRLEKFGAGDFRPYVEGASFVKLREISVTYDVPTKVASQLGPLKTLSVSVSGRNLHTWTNYSGLDPEVSNFGNQSIGRNYDVAPYPPSRSFWFSVTAGL